MEQDKYKYEDLSKEDREKIEEEKESVPGIELHKKVDPSSFLDALLYSLLYHSGMQPFAAYQPKREFKVDEKVDMKNVTFSKELYGAGILVRRPDTKQITQS